MSRKRQRSRATDDEVAAIDESESVQDQDSKIHANGGGDDNDDDDDDDERLTDEPKRGVEVWDVFKEEHHEVLEQLPLSLHRQFRLMRELDAQGEVFQADLLASIRRYICLRESLVARNAAQKSCRAEGAQSNPTVVSDVDVDQTPPTGLQADSLNGEAMVSENIRAENTLSATNQPKPGETTRTLLRRIAQTSEEAIRTVEEKVSIAQTAYETIDRHIRLLDQAIKEQEAAISLGVRPGTHLAPILLPDLIVPRWARPSRVEHSPVPSLSPEPELYLQEPPAPELPLPPQSSPKAPRKGKKAVAPKPAKPDKEEDIPVPPVVGGEEPAIAPRPRRTGVRLTIPAQPQPTEPSVPANPNEARYCYCNQVSFGTMIACDKIGCRMEWFHLRCTGLSEVPSKKAIWYCRECKPKVTQRGRSRV